MSTEAKIELAVLRDGGILLVCDNKIPDMIERVEFYRDPSLVLLHFRGGDEDQLFQYEVPEDMATAIERVDEVIIFVMFPDHEPIGYRAPLTTV